MAGSEAFTLEAILSLFKTAGGVTSSNQFHELIILEALSQ
jgi:hypothetical protein